MTPPGRGPLVAAVALVLALGALSAWLQAARDDLALPTSPEEELYLTQRATGRLAFTHRALAADLYWIRAIQYFGGRTRTAQERYADALAPPPALDARPPVSFDLLYPLLDITTTLDPRFNIAYRFGAVFLAEPYPHGPGRPDLAIKLLQKGLETSPTKWEYWEDIGFVYYWDVHDYLKASQAFERAADLPGGPWWMRSMAATMLVKGGDRNTSRLLWNQIYETANNEYARNAARVKLMQLKAIEDIEQLQAAIDAFGARRGAPVTTWSELLRIGALRSLPRDPAGVPYTLTSGSRVELSSASPLFPLPAEPETKSGR
ncbi:MAG TPA: hypothetical protein VG871_10735 [Vicinamibacterales bacterium]|nr:hypothetical protein [Vicinamibacterales bacterium]